MTDIRQKTSANLAMQRYQKERVFRAWLKLREILFECSDCSSWTFPVKGTVCIDSGSFRIHCEASSIPPMTKSPITRQAILQP